MLGRKTYDKHYIDACRTRVDAQVAAYDALATAARDGGGDGSGGAALDTFAPQFFNHMVLALDEYFVHRLRGQEGKDGNPANEVRLLAASIMENDGRLVADKQIRLTPESSVLGLAAGDEVRIDEDGFRRLADGYFAEIEKRFS
jgi:hypothetical protein